MMITNRHKIVVW